jgi:hypothetical protein
MRISRRNFIWTSAGAAGVGLVLGSSVKPQYADEEADRACPVEPQPIPHTHATPFGITLHNFFPGPVEGIDPNTGHDPSVITDNFCLGVWQKSGRSSYKLNHFELGWDPNGHFIGPARIQERYLGSQRQHLRGALYD